MTVISRRIISPIVGKADIALERAKRLAAVIARTGAPSRVARVIMGCSAGDIEVYGRYPNFSAGTKAFQAIMAYPDMKALQAEREKGPAADLAGPYVYRTVFGEVSPQPIILQREYQLPRANLKAALGLLPEARALFDKSTGMAAFIPVFAPAMDRLVISYYSDSIDAMGRIIDETAMSEAFQNIVARAGQHGALIAARVLATI
jgi:hypothetical protein